MPLNGTTGHEDGAAAPAPVPRAGGALGGQLLTITEAAAALNVPTTWLRDKVTARRVPHTRLGRHVRFTAAHLQQIVNDGEQPASQLVDTATGDRRGRRRRPS